MRHTKRNFYNKRLTLRRGMYLDIDMRKHHSRECHTHSRTHTYTHSIQLYFFAITLSRTHYHWKWYAKEPACKGNRQPVTLYKSHHTHLIDFPRETSARSFDVLHQYLSKSYVHQCAELYLSSDGVGTNLKFKYWPNCYFHRPMWKA